MKSGIKQGKLFVQLFGGLTVYYHRDPAVVPWQCRQSRQLFSYLLMTSDQWINRDRLKRYLWPDRDVSTLSVDRNFKTILARLRKSFSGFGLDPVMSQGEAYRINFEAIICDHALFRSYAAAGIQHMSRDESGAAQECLETALGLYRAELLPEESADPVIGSMRRDMAHLMEAVRALLEQIYQTTGQADLLNLLTLCHQPVPVQAAGYLPCLDPRQRRPNPFTQPVGKGTSRHSPGNCVNRSAPGRFAPRW